MDIFTLMLGGAMVFLLLALYFFMNTRPISTGKFVLGLVCLSAGFILLSRLDLGTNKPTTPASTTQPVAQPVILWEPLDISKHPGVHALYESSTLTTQNDK